MGAGNCPWGGYTDQNLYEGNWTKRIRIWRDINISQFLTGIARLVHVFDLNLTTQILIFQC